MFYKFFFKKDSNFVHISLNLIKIANSISFLSNLIYFNSLCSNIKNIRIIIFRFSQKWLIRESNRRKHCIFLNNIMIYIFVLKHTFTWYKKIYKIPFKKLKLILKSRKKMQITKKLHELYEWKLHLKAM